MGLQQLKERYLNTDLEANRFLGVLMHWSDVLDTALGSIPILENTGSATSSLRCRL